MKKGVVIFIVVLVITALISLLLFYEKKINIIKIGFLGDLSNEKVDKLALIGAELAVEKINTNTELTGNKAELIVYDTKNQSELIESYFNKLANEDKVLAIISTHTDKGEIPNKLKVPTIFTGQDKVEAKRGDRFYWDIGLSYIISDGVYHTVKKLKNNISINNAVLITDNQQFANDYDSAVKEVLPLFNISLLGYFTLDENLALVSKIKGLNPDMVIVSTNTENAIKFLKGAKSKSLSPKIFLARVSPLALQANDQDLPDVFYIHNYVTSLIRTPGTENLNAFMIFDKKIAERTNGTSTSSVSLNAYDAVNLLDVTLRKRISISNTPKSLEKDREKVINALWATRGYQTSRGLLFADGKSGFLRRNFYKIMVINNGQVSLLTGS